MGLLGGLLGGTALRADTVDQAIAKRRERELEAARDRNWQHPARNRSIQAQRAEPYVRALVRHRRSFYGESSKEHAAALLDWSKVLEDLGRISESEAAFARAENLRRQLAEEALPSGSKAEPDFGALDLDGLTALWSTPAGRRHLETEATRTRISLRREFPGFAEPRIRRAALVSKRRREDRVGFDLPDPYAQTVYDRGVRLFRKGRFQDALPHFQRAYRLSVESLEGDDPRLLRLLWRLTKTQRKLDDLRTPRQRFSRLGGLDRDSD